VAILAIPPLVRGLGPDRFGVLMLAWALIGYFSLFDLGLGRALTQLLAHRLGTGQTRDVRELVWTSLVLVAAMGVMGGVVAALLGPALIRGVLRIPERLQDESLGAFYLVAFSIPFVVGTAAFRGILEAYQRFDLSNVLRLPLAVFTFLAPLLVLPFSRSVFVLVLVLVLGRVLGWLIHALMCLRAVPVLTRGVKVDFSQVFPLLRFGSWMTVSNVVGPLMVYLDRFLVGALISTAAVTYYATPYEIVTRLWVFPAAVGGVLFPAFASTFAQDPGRTAVLFRRAVKLLFVMLFPVTLVLVALAHEGLGIWLGTQFANQSTRVLQWLAIGVLLNSLAQMAFALVQGTGRADLTAKLHLVELPFYLLVLWLLLSTRGIEGAAIAWTARAAVDTVFLFGVAGSLLHDRMADFRTVAALTGALSILALAFLPTDPVTKGLFLFLTLFAFTLAAWFLLLSQEERRLGRNLLKPAPD
jgi:O-antigen/teichoic acid export membrane protein